MLETKMAASCKVNIVKTLKVKTKLSLHILHKICPIFMKNKAMHFFITVNANEQAL